MNLDPAPDLWPGMNRDTTTARAWITTWDQLAPGYWEHTSDVIAVVTQLVPGVKRDTMNKLIHKAWKAGHLQRRGRYSHKDDARMIRRKDAA